VVGADDVGVGDAHADRSLLDRMVHGHHTPLSVAKVPSLCKHLQGKASMCDTEEDMHTGRFVKTLSMSTSHFRVHVTVVSCLEAEQHKAKHLQALPKALYHSPS
jgi:hypothetical protein